MEINRRQVNLFNKPWNQMTGGEKIIFGLEVFAEAYYKVHEEEFLKSDIQELESKLKQQDKDKAKKKRLDDLRANKKELQGKITRMEPPDTTLRILP